MITGVYGFFDKETNECLYVGQTADSIQSRYNEHIKKLKSGKHIRSEWVEWFNAHHRDPEAMIFTLLEEGKPSELNKLEIKWFALLEPLFYGKEPSENETWAHSAATKAKISASVTQLHKWEERQCAYKYCSLSFTIRKVKAKRFCSKSCAMKDKYDYRPIDNDLLLKAKNLRAKGLPWLEICDKLEIFYKDLRKLIHEDGI